MPPRHTYWTILIGSAPTAFRAREREELLPTFERLRATQPDAVLRWFERGRLWNSPEEARRPHEAPPREFRGRDWRPGGSHRDPRDRFQGKVPSQGRGPKGEGFAQGRRPKDEGQWRPKGEQRPWKPKPRPRDDEPRDRKPRDGESRDREPRDERARRGDTRPLKKRRK